jgi:hypothetical protein
MAWIGGAADPGKSAECTRGLHVVRGRFRSSSSTGADERNG